MPTRSPAHLWAELIREETTARANPGLSLTLESFLRFQLALLI